MKLNHLQKSSICSILFILFIFYCKEFAMADSLSPKPDSTNVSQTEETVNEMDEPELLDGLYYTENEIYYYILGIMQTGWQKIEGQKYYFSVKTGVALKGKHRIGNAFYYFRPNGTMRTGWVKIDGQKYYFSEKNGKMMTNCIAGTKNTGFYYVGADGIRVTEPEIKAAVNYVKKYTKNSWTNDVKLQKCYQALRDNYHYQASQEKPTVQKLSEYAYNLLTYGQGNCYRYAAGFTCIAKVLGYKSRINIGKVSSRYGGMASHGWAEVKSYGIWHKCDVNMNLYMHTGKTSRKYERLKMYKLVVQKGKVFWL